MIFYSVCFAENRPGRVASIRAEGARLLNNCRGGGGNYLKTTPWSVLPKISLSRPLLDQHHEKLRCFISIFSECSFVLFGDYS